MCGRTACTLTADEVQQACTYTTKSGQLSKPAWKASTVGKYRASYNKGPKSYSPILVSQSSASTDSLASTERFLQAMRWGLVPSWHRGDPNAFSFNMINCRIDTITEKRTFMSALQRGQRCVVLAEGFYEWQQSGKGSKQPYFIRVKNQAAAPAETTETGAVCREKPSTLVAMAGLYDVAKDPQETDGLLYTYTIITVDASESIKWLHHRMPAILDTDDAIEKWLDSKRVNWKEALECLQPRDCLDWYPVSSTVNNVRNNTPECMQKIDLSKSPSKESGSSKAMTAWLKKASPAKKPKMHEDEDEVPAENGKKS